MNNNDKKKFAELVYGLAEENGGSVTKNGVKLKFEALKEYSIEQITNASTWLVSNRTEKFPPVPKVTEFKKAIESISGQSCGNTQAQLECDKVLKKLKEWGRDAQPLFYNKTTTYLMTHRWTFQALGQMDEKDMKWFRRDFVEAWTDMEETPIPLIDVAEKAGMIPAGDLKKLTTGNKI